MEPNRRVMRLGGVAAVTGVAESKSQTDLLAVEAGFEDFYSAAHDRIRRALALTLRNDELARDATAEAMARAYQKWRTVSTYRNPSGWVYRVGLNWANSRLRKRRREVTTAVDPERPQLDPNVAEPKLTAALASLPIEQRSVVVLRYYLDWSEAQTAAALAIPAGTVKSRLSRALDTLADILEDADEPG